MEGFDLDLDWVSGMNLLPRISRYSCFKLVLRNFEKLFELNIYY